MLLALIWSTVHGAVTLVLDGPLPPAGRDADRLCAAVVRSLSELVAKEEGLFIGHSAGANIAAAIKLAERAQKEQGGGCVVTIAPDRSDRYFAPIKWEKRHTW